MVRMGLNPATPALPKVSNSQPPTKAPAMPMMMSVTTVAPIPLTVRLAMNPAARPRMIHVNSHAIPASRIRCVAWL